MSKKYRVIFINGVIVFASAPWLMGHCQGMTEVSPSGMQQFNLLPLQILSLVPQLAIQTGGRAMLFVCSVIASYIYYHLSTGHRNNLEGMK